MKQATAMEGMDIICKRIYDAPEEGYRILVDRLWPRGIRKDAVDLWLKEAAPSNELRKWYNHEPEKYTEFRERYREELKKGEAADRVMKACSSHERIILLYSAKNQNINNAVVLREWIMEKLNVQESC